MEQLKILDIVNRWGYLTSYQIAELLNKNRKTVETILTVLKNKNLININKLARKNIYTTTGKGNSYLGRNAKGIKINFNELVHQDLLIKWISQQTDILSYQTEKELKAENPREKGYPDLLVNYENRSIIVELERTRKSKERYIWKIMAHRKYIKNDFQVLWLVPNESMKNFIQERINEFNWKKEIHHIQLFKTHN